MRFLFEQLLQRLDGVTDTDRFDPLTFFKESLSFQTDGWGKDHGYCALANSTVQLTEQPLKDLFSSISDEFSEVFAATAWRQNLRDCLESGSVFETVGQKIFFPAVVEGEGAFLTQLLPFRSHEERLTGSLLSTLALNVQQYSQVAESVDSAGGVALDIFDLATDKGERATGADIGILVRSGREGERFIKAARLQVKTAEQSAGRSIMGAAFTVAHAVKDADKKTADVVFQGTFHQILALKGKPQLGYYLVMVEAGEHPPHTSSMCLIVPATRVYDQIRRDREVPDFRKTANIEDDLQPIPLPIFLGLGMASKNSAWGLNVSGENEREQLEAAVALLSGEGGIPRFCLTVDTTGEAMDFTHILSSLKARKMTARAERVAHHSHTP